jgi:hypothetical protein
MKEEKEGLEPTANCKSKTVETSKTETKRDFVGAQSKKRTKVLTNAVIKKKNKCFKPRGN